MPVCQLIFRTYKAVVHKRTMPVSPLVFRTLSLPVPSASGRSLHSEKINCCNICLKSMPIFLLVPSTRASICKDDLETIVLHRIKCQISRLVFRKETHWLHVNIHSVHPATAPLIFTSKQMTMSSLIHVVSVQLSVGLQAALAVNIHNVHPSTSHCLRLET